MKAQPLVSVLMTAYNREDFISEAIESVIISSYKNWQLIIVDDGSTDGTVEIIKRYTRQDMRIEMHINEHNLGDYSNRNRAASFARGEYIMSVDSDDKIFSDGIERCVNVMTQYDANIGMYHYLGTETKILNAEKAIRSHLLERPFLAMGPGGTIIKRHYFENIKGYPEKYGPANDMYFNLKACSQSPVVMLGFEFYFYRRHINQEINNHLKYLYGNYSYIRDALKELNLFLTPEEKKWLSNKNKRRFLTNLAKYFLKTRDIKNAKRALLETGFNIKDALSAVFH